MDDQRPGDLAKRVAASRRDLQQQTPDPGSADDLSAAGAAASLDASAAAAVREAEASLKEMADEALSAGTAINDLFDDQAAMETSIEMLMHGPPLYEPLGPITIPDDLADFQARNEAAALAAERAKAERLSAIIERHTRPLQDALRDLRESAEADSRDVQRLHRIVVVETAALVGLTILLVIVGVLALSH